MDPLINLTEILQTPAFQQQYATAIREQACASNSFLSYRDPQGRLVREYPASGEVYEVGEGGKTLTLLSGHGVPAQPSTIPVPSQPTTQAA